MYENKLQLTDAGVNKPTDTRTDLLPPSCDATLMDISKNHELCVFSSCLVSCGL